ncbi:ABC transporter permease [Pseudonocardia cypriaca]|uniref:Transport permease protein n=1 Tax=Pseudonocardia cypriaca TaxID=882449 RepID=A0A543GEQ6_9PSEU|nr:ABC transporter permease [Pseudonocardia cypriaca]TQM44554.1 ABC-2 type transport system permease protein [Pseudonocardia cypriaca]
MSVVAARPPASWAEPVRLLAVRTGALGIVELQKLRSDNTELVTRMVQPVLWLLIFGQIFSGIRAIPTGGLSYLEFLTPGILAQSALFVAIFFGIQIIWERDAGILTKVMVTPTPRAAIVMAKAFAAGLRGLAPVVVLVPVAALLGVGITLNPLKLVAAAIALMLSAGFFSCLSMAIAGVAQTRDRLMGIGQLMTMPLFFASNALYPIDIMPTWLQVISQVNPLTYLVNALRGLLVDAPANLWADFAVLVGAAVIGIVGAAALLGKLVR